VIALTLPWPLWLALAALVVVGVTSLAGRVARHRTSVDVVRPSGGADAPFQPGAVAALHDRAAELARRERARDHEGR